MALVDQTDDALGQASAIVRLDAGRVDRGVPPAIRNELLGGRWIRTRAESPRGRWEGARRRGHAGASTEHHHHRHRLVRVGRRHEGHPDVDGDVRVCGVVDRADELAAHHRTSAHVEAFRAIDLPGHVGDVGRHAAKHLAIELLDNLRSALFPPDVRARDLLAVLEGQDVGQIRIRIREGFVVVGVVGCRLVPARA